MGAHVVNTLPLYNNCKRNIASCSCERRVNESESKSIVSRTHGICVCALARFEMDWIFATNRF